MPKAKTLMTGGRDKPPSTKEGSHPSADARVGKGHVAKRKKHQQSTGFYGAQGAGKMSERIKAVDLAKKSRRHKAKAKKRARADRT